MQAGMHLSHSPASSVAVEIGLKRPGDSRDFSGGVSAASAAVLIASVLMLES